MSDNEIQSLGEFKPVFDTAPETVLPVASPIANAPKREIPTEIWKLEIGKFVNVYRLIPNTDQYKLIKRCEIVNKVNRDTLVLRVGGLFDKLVQGDLFIIKNSIFMIAGRNARHKLIGFTFMGEVKKDKLIVTPQDKEFAEIKPVTLT